MAGMEIWITDVRAIDVHAECVRVELISGGEPIVLRLARATLVKGLGLGFGALDTSGGGQVVQFRHPA